MHLCSMEDVLDEYGNLFGLNIYWLAHPHLYQATRSSGKFKNIHVCTHQNSRTKTENVENMGKKKTNTYIVCMIYHPEPYQL